MRIKKVILIGFTKWQTECAYQLYKKSFAKYDVKLDLLKIDEYVLAIEKGKPSINVDNYDFSVMLVKDQYISTLFPKKPNLVSIPITICVFQTTNF